MSRQSLKNVGRLIELANKELPVNESFLADFKRSVEITEDKSSGLPSPTFKPSSLNCKRGCYYQIMQAQPDEGKSSFNMIGICNSGSDIHVRVQTAVMQMKENGMDCEYIDVADFVKSRGLDYLEIKSKSGMETKLYHKELNMSFMCDGIIRYKGKYYILELKTENSYKFMSRQDTDPSHYNQATAYSLAFGIDDVLFVYISRDILDMKAFMFHVTPEMRDNLLEYIHECDGYVERHIAPPKPEDVTRKTCTY